MNNGVFISGTDTGVGKTVVSAVIIRALIYRGIKVGVMKPFETGCVRAEDNYTLTPADGTFLRDMAEMDDSLDLVTPVRFEQPLAPMVASEIEKKNVELEKVINAYNELSKKYDFVVVEGIGGLLVPLLELSRSESESRTYYVTDLIKDLKLPVVIVSRPGLGTINQTLLTVNHALREGLEVSAVVINSPINSEDTVAERTNPEVLMKLSTVPVIGTVPYMDPASRSNIDTTALNIGNKIAELLFFQ